MGFMRRLMLGVCLALAALRLAQAGPLEDGLAAARSGDYAMALSLWRPLAEQGDSLAQWYVALSYRKGEGVARDSSEAIKWFRLAANQGMEGAQTVLARMYDQGDGIPRDYAEAFNWYRILAERNPYANERLGDMYYHGQGVLRDYEEAAKRFRLAAERGVTQAQMNLGTMLRDGKGVSKNFDEAVFWWSRAIQQASRSEYLNWECTTREGNTFRSLIEARILRVLSEGGTCRYTAIPQAAAPPSTARERQEREPSNRKNATVVRTMGTAFAIAKDVLLTNHHVVESCRRIRTQPEGAIARVIASNKDLDLAALRTTATFRDFARISSVDDIVLGQDIVIAGFPLSGLLSEGLNVTTGTVSAVAGLRNDMGTYQITAPIQPGNSGGPVFDRSGLVVGIVVSKLDDLAIAKATGSLPQNVNFAVSLRALRLFLLDKGIPTTAPSSTGTSKRDVSEIAASAKRFTVPITCTHD